MRNENLAQPYFVSQTGSKFLGSQIPWFDFLTHLITVKLWGRSLHMTILITKLQG